MYVKYCPQRSDKVIEYQIKEEVITTKLNGKTDIFDFTSLVDGRLEYVDTILSVNPIVSAKRENGELFVELLYYYGQNATQKELFPEWQVV